MILYHEVTPSALTPTLRHGLKRTLRGVKGANASIEKTDLFLDENRPTKLQQLGVSRCNNLYAFIGSPKKIVSITNGKTHRLSDFVQQSDQALLCLEVDPSKCFVSNLDLYDAVLNAIKDSDNSQALQRLAHTYWSNIVLLTDYIPKSISRPEVLITYDVPSTHITVMNEGDASM